MNIIVHLDDKSVTIGLEPDMTRSRIIVVY